MREVRKIDEGAWLIKSVAKDLVVPKIDFFRKFQSPYGPMSISCANFGDYGWIARKAGYGYNSVDFDGNPWPKMPDEWCCFAKEIASECGYDFSPNSALVNMYHPGSKLGVHIDKDEGDFSHPIVSVSLGVSANFIWKSHANKILLEHGDVFVFGGKSRMTPHGVDVIKRQHHETFGDKRINITFRRYSPPI